MGSRVRPEKPRTSRLSAFSLAAGAGEEVGLGEGPGMGHSKPLCLQPMHSPRCSPSSYVSPPAPHTAHLPCCPPAAPPWPQSCGCRRGGRPRQSRPQPAPPWPPHRRPPGQRAPPAQTTGPGRRPRRPRRRVPRLAAGARLQAGRGGGGGGRQAVNKPARHLTQAWRSLKRWPPQDVPAGPAAAPTRRQRLQPAPVLVLAQLLGGQHIHRSLDDALVVVRHLAGGGQVAVRG
jgi:hypothetical protein